AREVLELIRVLLVVEEKPRTFQVADVRVAAGHEAPVFAAAMLGTVPLAEGVDAGDERRAPGGIGAPSEMRSEVEALDAGRNGHAREAEKRREDVLRIERGVEPLPRASEPARPVKEHGDPDRLVVRLLLVPRAVRAHKI